MQRRHFPGTLAAGERTPSVGISPGHLPLENERRCCYLGHFPRAFATGERTPVRILTYALFNYKVVLIFGIRATLVSKSSNHHRPIVNKSSRKHRQIVNRSSKHHQTVINKASTNHQHILTTSSTQTSSTSTAQRGIAHPGPA